jgi:hypothetical protein
VERVAIDHEKDLGAEMGMLNLSKNGRIYSKIYKEIDEHRAGLETAINYQ